MFLTAAGSALLIGAIFRLTSGKIPDDEIAPATPKAMPPAASEAQQFPQLRPALAIISAPDELSPLTVKSEFGDASGTSSFEHRLESEKSISDSLTGSNSATIPILKPNSASQGTCTPVPTGTRRDKIVVAARATDPGA